MVDFTDQRLTGRTTLFWFLDTVSREWLQRLAACVSGLEAAEALACVISRQPLSAPSDGADMPIRLLDPSSGLAAMLGVSSPGLAVADTRGRLHAVVGDTDPEAGLALAQALYAATPTHVVAGQAPVLIVDRVLEPEFRERLIAYWQASTKLANAVAAGEQAHVANRMTKRRQDVVIDDPALHGAFRDRVVRRVPSEIRKAFNVRVTQMEAPRIGCYDAADGGWFRRHRDNTTKFTAHRLFAMSLNLNTGAYEGGEVRFPEYGRQLYSPPAGGAVVFSCSLLHEALPVTRGRRFGVFTFFHDEAGEAQVRALQEAERAAGRAGHPMRDNS